MERLTSWMSPWEEEEKMERFRDFNNASKFRTTKMKGPN